MAPIHEKRNRILVERNRWIVCGQKREIMKHIERADEGIEVNDYPGTIVLESRKCKTCITPSKKKRKTKKTKQSNQSSSQLTQTNLKKITGNNLMSQIIKRNLICCFPVWFLHAVTVNAKGEMFTP